MNPTALCHLRNHEWEGQIGLQIGCQGKSGNILSKSAASNLVEVFWQRINFKYSTYVKIALLNETKSSSTGVNVYVKLCNSTKQKSNLRERIHNFDLPHKNPSKLGWMHGKEDTNVPRNILGLHFCQQGLHQPIEKIRQLWPSFFLSTNPFYRTFDKTFCNLDVSVLNVNK